MAGFSENGSRTRLQERSAATPYGHSVAMLLLAALLIVVAALTLALPLPVFSSQALPDASERGTTNVDEPGGAAPLLDAAGSVTIPLCISVAYQGHGDPGTSRWTLPVVTTIYTASTSGVITSWVQTTDANGGYCHDVHFDDNSISFDIEVKHSHTLSNKKFGIPVSGPASPINMGTLLEGDADNNNAVSLADFSILRTTYAQTCPPCDDRADFNVDGYISILDFSLLRTNYTRSGPITVP